MPSLLGLRRQRAVFYTIRGLLENKDVPLRDTAYANCTDELLDFRIASGDFYEMPDLDEGLLRFKNTAVVLQLLSVGRNPARPGAHKPSESRQLSLLRRQHRLHRTGARVVARQRVRRGRPVPVRRARGHRHGYALGRREVLLRLLLRQALRRLRGGLLHGRPRRKRVRPRVVHPHPRKPS